MEAEQADAAGSYGGTSGTGDSGQLYRRDRPGYVYPGGRCPGASGRGSGGKDTAQPQAAEEPEDTDDAAGMEEPDTAALGADIQALMEEQKIQPEDEELPKAEKSGGKLAGGGHPKSGASKAKAADDVLPKIEEPEEEGHQAITRLSKEQREILHILCRLREWNSSCARRLRGAAARLSSGKTASTGNMIIQGGQGSGKTVLATSMIKGAPEGSGQAERKNRQDRSFRAESERCGGAPEKVAGGCLIIEKAGAISKRDGSQAWHAA